MISASWSSSAKSEQAQSLKHLHPDATETDPCLQGISLRAVRPPVVFIHPPLDVAQHPFCDNTIAGCLQNDLPAIQLKRVTHSLGA